MQDYGQRLRERKAEARPINFVPSHHIRVPFLLASRNKARDKKRSKMLMIYRLCLPISKNKQIDLSSKGQLILKCLFGAIVWTKIPSNFYPGFLPQPLKRCRIKKIKALSYTNQGLFNIIDKIQFLIQPLFRGQGRNPGKIFIGFFVQTMTPKRHFEIN